MSGLFGKLADSSNKNSSRSGPSSLQTPSTSSKKSLGLFAGLQHETTAAGGSSNDVHKSHGTSASTTTHGPFTNCTPSPVHVGRSLREFEEQMAALRKENFNLKLRIYFLEEKPSSSTAAMSSSSAPAAEATQKQLIDLKVENESLRKELEEKQNLLCQASQAMEMIEGEHKKQAHESQMIIDDLNHRIESMTHEMRNLEKALYACSKNNDIDFSEFLGAVSSKDIEAQRKIQEFESLMSNFSDQNEQLCQKIESMERDQADLVRKMNEMKYENIELKEKLTETEKLSDGKELKKLHDECYDSKRKLVDAERRLNEKTEAHEKSMQVIKRACEHIDDLEIHVEQLKSNQPSSLSSTESAKNDEIFTHANSLIVKLRDQVEQVTADKDDEIKRLREELSGKSTSFIKTIANETVPKSSTAPLNLTQQIFDFPIDETTFNTIIERNRMAMKKIHFLKQRLSSHAPNKIENEFLQLQLKEAQSDLQETEAALRRSATLCGVLLERLEDLTRFLCTLLQGSDVKLGAELRRAIAKAVDRTLDLSRNVNLTKSIQVDAASHLSDCSMIDLVDSLASSTIADDPSFIDSLRSDYRPSLADSLMMKSSTKSCTSRTQRSKNPRKLMSFFSQQSDDEEWSEPDRDISQQRIGIKTEESCTVSKRTTSTTSDEDEDHDNDFGVDHKLIKKSEWKLVQGKIKTLESLLQEKNDKILEVSGMLLDSENEAKEKILRIREKLDETERDLLKYRNLHQLTANELCSLRDQLQQTKTQKDQLNLELHSLTAKLDSQADETRAVQEKCHKLAVEYETKCDLYDKLVSAVEKREDEFRDELQVNWIRKTVYNQLLHELDKKKDKLKEFQHKFSLMEEEMKIMQHHVLENEEKFEKMSKNLDQATLQLTSTSIERSRALNEKRSLDTKLKKANEEFSKLNMEKQELNLKIADLEVFNAKLQNKLLTGEKLLHPLKHPQSSEYGSGYASEEANAAQHRSPSLSSNEEKDKEFNANCASCQRLRGEVVDVKKNLQSSKRSLEMAYAKLRSQNLKKAQTELDIKQQIVKTQNVLQNVRTSMENEMTRAALRRDEAQAAN